MPLMHFEKSDSDVYITLLMQAWNDYKTERVGKQEESKGKRVDIHE